MLISNLVSPLILYKFARLISTKIYLPICGKDQREFLLLLFISTYIKVIQSCR